MLQWSGDQRKQNATTALAMVLLVGAVVAFLYLFAGQAMAQTAGSVASPDSSLNTGLTTIEQPLGLPSTDIRLIIARIIRVALGLVGIVLLGLVLYAGFVWMTAGGNEEQITKGKKLLTNAVVGLVIMLSAFAIASFVINMLVGSTGGGVVTGTGAPGAGVGNVFVGSGALGGIIKDHYPERDQTEVARNTKIVITFRKPVRMDTFAQNTNQSLGTNGAPLYGDCVNIGSAMDWKKDCDQLILDDDHISIRRSDTNEPIVGAAVLASYDNGKAFTIVIRPNDSLGNATDKVGYKVRLGKALLLDDIERNYPSIFGGSGAQNQFYSWQFTCSTALDNAPPAVVSVFPGAGAREARNTVIQIDFSEPMDPTGLQGIFGNGPDHFTLAGQTLFLKTAQSSVPVGKFLLTNGYKTMEFISSQECGVNACGGKIYCLPVCDRAGATCSEDGYDVLVKAAQKFSISSFEGVPFSGAMDLSGNALDGNRDSRPQIVSSTARVFPDQKQPDNFFWDFKITNTIDAAAPYLQQVTPGLDGANVTQFGDVAMVFSKRMQAEPMYDIGLEQQPALGEPLCKVPRVTFLNDGTTRTLLNHCPFAKDDRVYYFPVLTSGLLDTHYNCFYPAKGPGGSQPKGLKQSLTCDEAGKNCCAVSAGGADSVAFCCNGLNLPQAGSATECLQYLRGISR